MVIPVHRSHAKEAAVVGATQLRRRAFLRSSALAVLGAVTVACSDDDDNGGGDAEPGTSPSATSDDGAAVGLTGGDVDLAVAAIQIENTAAAAYDAIAEVRAADLQAAGLSELAGLFRDHHVEHAEALNELLADNDAAEVPDGALFAGITLPTEDDIATMPIADLVAFTRGMENQAAQTYITASPRLILGDLRQLLMSIGAAQARHVAAYDILMGGGVGGYTTTTAPVVAGNYPTNESLLNS